ARTRRNRVRLVSPPGERRTLPGRVPAHQRRRGRRPDRGAAHQPGAGDRGRHAVGARSAVAGSRGLRIFGGTLLIGLLLAGGLAWLRGRTPQLAPDFSVADVEGKTVRLSALRGKVVLVNVWATWCPPCRDEMPSMERLYRQLAGPDFELLAVSEDEGGI